LPHLNWSRKAGMLEIVSKQKCGLITATNAVQPPHHFSRSGAAAQRHKETDETRLCVAPLRESSSQLIEGG